MSNSIAISAILLLALALHSCKKDEDKGWGTVTALKNGDAWSGEIRATTNRFSDQKFDIQIKNRDDQGFWISSLSFYKIPIKEGKYKLLLTFNQPPDDSLSGALYSDGHDDQLHNFFRIAQNDSLSYLEVTSVNKKKTEIKGRFNLTLWRRKDFPHSWNAPDSIVFSDGVFHTRILD